MPGPRKYLNKTAVVDGIKFDSKREARRYGQLKLLARTGQITDLRLQVPFILAPSVKYAKATRAKPALKYTADFVYTADGRQVVEDAKGVKTEAYVVRKHLMMSVHGIEIQEV